MPPKPPERLRLQWPKQSLVHRNTTKITRPSEFRRTVIVVQSSCPNGACAHYVMVSKFQWKPFWLATQRDPQNDWTATQNRVNYDVFVQAPFTRTCLKTHTHTHTHARARASANTHTHSNVYTCIAGFVVKGKFGEK